MSQDNSYSRHQSYKNRFRTSSTGSDSHSGAKVTARQPTSTSEEADPLGQSAHLSTPPLTDDGPQQSADQPSAPQGTSTGQEQPAGCSEIAVSLEANSPGEVSNSQTDPSQDVHQVPVPTAPGKPRRLSRQMSAGTKRQNFAAGRTLSGKSTSADSTRDDVFLELDVDTASDDQQQQVWYDSSMFPSKKRGQVLSTSSSTSILPNPYNRLNHRLHDAVWFCNCLYFVFFCCLPAVHYMEQCDVEYRLNNQKRASRLGRISTILFFVGLLLTLLFFSLVFFLVIYFTTR